MLSQEEYAELEEIINQKVQNPQFSHPRFELLEEDPKNYILHQNLLENSDSPYVFNYCSRYLKILVCQDSPIWNAQLLTEILEWIPAFFQKRIEIIFQFDRSLRIVIIDNLTQLFVYILSQIYDSNSKPEEFFAMISNSMPDADIPHRMLRYLFFRGVISEIGINNLTQKIRAQIVADKSDSTLIDLFAEVVDSNFSQEYDFSQSDQAEMVQTFLELLLSILCLYNKKKKESPENETDDFLCDLNANYKDILKNEGFINPLFSFFNFSEGDQGNDEIIELLFKILNEIFSVKLTYFPDKKDQASIIVPTIINLTQLMEMGISKNQNAFHEMSFAINHMSVYFDDKMVAEIEEPFSNFLSTLREATGPFLEDPREFIDRNAAIVNIMNFWSIVSSKNSNIQQISDMALPLFQSYIQILMKCSSECPDDIVNILDLDKYNICDTIKIIPRLLKRDFATLGVPLESAAQSVFDLYKSIVSEKKDSPEDQEQFRSCDIQMSIFILTMTCGLRNPASGTQLQYKKMQPDDFENIFFKFILDVIEFTDANIQTIFAMNGMYLEQAIYVFSRWFRRTVFARFSDSEEENGTVLSFFNRIIKRLVDALYEIHVFYNDHSYAFENLLAIESLYDYLDISSKPKDKAAPTICYAYSLDVTKELIESVANRNFQFIINPEICLNFKKEISLLMKILRSIVSKESDFIQPFLKSIEEKFEACSSGDQNVVATLVFIYELIGIFSNDVGVSEVKIDFDTSSSTSSSTSGSTSSTSEFEASKPTSVNQSFPDFFNWAFPGNLDTLSKIAPQASEDPYIASAYLKFWYILMSQVTALTKQPLTKKTAQIFPKHSANSIILFTMVANVLTSYFQVTLGIETDKDSYYKENLKPLKNAMFLMSESLGAEYIMFGAFELYSDPTLANLLNAFMNKIENYDLDVIFQYPKVALAFMKVIDSLCKNHLMSIAECSQPFFDYLFRVITVGLTQINDLLVSVTIESGVNLGSFLQTNKAIQSIVAEAIGRNQAGITQILTIGFNFFLSNSEFMKKFQYKLLKLIGYFLSILPDFLSSLADSLMPQVPQEAVPEYTEIFQELIKTVSDLFVFDRFKQNMTNLKRLADNIHLKVPMP